MKTCEDCGTKMINSFCPNCQEAVFILDQYRELDMPMPSPDGKLMKEYEQQMKRLPNG